MSWSAHLWRRARGTPRAPRLLLLIVYLAGVSIGNHLLALLAGPAIIMFLVSTLLTEQSADPVQRREEWGQTAVVAGVWALLIGLGLGSTGLILIGGLCFAAAAAYAVPSGAGIFAAATLLIACIGLTPYLYLYIRSAQSPPINEAAPATFAAPSIRPELPSMIRRSLTVPTTLAVPWD